MIGLCLAFEAHNNYGTQLQAYATVQAVKALGYDCEIIVYQKKRGLLDYVKESKRLFHDGAAKSVLNSFKRKLHNRGNSAYAVVCRERGEEVMKFKNQYLFPLAKTYVGFPALTKGAEKYSTVLVGSDQVWLPVGYASKFYNMMFVPDHIPKMSYASSFGVSAIPEYHQKEAKEFLDRIDFVSVRETTGKEIVERVSDNTAQVVVDPTMLIDPQDWERICVKPEEEKYIFCYFLGRRREGREQAKILSEKTGLKIVVLKHLDEYIAEDDDFGDFAPNKVGPEKFISYIKNAEYVLTDSFHGTVFSILFKKKFMTFYRFHSGDKLSKNSRIDSLLGQLGLKHRCYSAGDIQKQISEEIDYAVVDGKLQAMRAQSQAFLENALRECGERYDRRNRA